MKVLADSVSGESSLSGSWKAVLSLCPHSVEGAKELCQVSLIRALIPFMRAPPTWPNHCPKAPLPDTIIWGVRLQHRHLSVAVLFLIQNPAQGTTLHVDIPFPRLLWSVPASQSFLVFHTLDSLRSIHYQIKELILKKVKWLVQVQRNYRGSACFSDLSLHWNHWVGLLELGLLGPTHRVSDSVALSEAKICISSKFSGDDDDAASPGTTFLESLY